MKIEIPGSTLLTLETLILDLNGTLTVNGKLIAGVEEKIQQVKDKGLHVVLFSGDTRGTGKIIADQLEIDLIKTAGAKEKAEAAQEREPTKCVAIGNGLIDAKLFDTVELAIATLQAEGVHTKTLLAADIVVPTIIDALDLLIDEQSLIATLRQ